jgi:LacI family sucrose operon transcriptional repressor
MTIKEVARLAGVSSAAVSRYLSGGPLSKEKKERISRAIDETGYRPNLMAKTMRTGKVKVVGIIVPRIFSESVNQIMDGIAEELRERDYMTLLGYSDSKKDRELQYLSIMQSNRVAGIILMATTLSEIKRQTLESCSVPLVITGQELEGLPCVFHDDRGAVRELTARMIEKGRKRIVYIGVTEEDRAAGLERRIGVQEALRAAGLDAEGLPCETADFNAQGGYEAMCRLLDRCPEPDGVICATDIILV